jgi:hypothetical protein
MAAVQAVLTLVKAGQRVVVSDNVYGGTHRLFTKVLANYALEFAFLDASDPARLEREAGRFDLLWIETPSNPLLKICDVRALAELAHRRGAVLVADNTFMSPFFQRPLDLGADLVVHSTTKFLNGHSDSVGGVAVAKHEEHAEWLRFVQNASRARSRGIWSSHLTRGLPSARFQAGILRRPHPRDRLPSAIPRDPVASGARPWPSDPRRVSRPAATRGLRLRSRLRLPTTRSRRPTRGTPRGRPRSARPRAPAPRRGASRRGPRGAPRGARGAS